MHPTKRQTIKKRSLPRSPLPNSPVESTTASVVMAYRSHHAYYVPQIHTHRAECAGMQTAGFQRLVRQVYREWKIVPRYSRTRDPAHVLRIDSPRSPSAAWKSATKWRRSPFSNGRGRGYYWDLSGLSSGSWHDRNREKRLRSG